MVEKDRELLKRLLATFKIEAQERINAVSSGIIALETAASAAITNEICERIFREVHSLKGAARAVNMLEVEAVCQALEGVFATLNRREITLSPQLFDVLHQTVDSLGQAIHATEMAHAVGEHSQLSDLIPLLDSAARGGLPPSNQDALEPLAAGNSLARRLEAYRPLTGERPAPTETVRISTTKLDAVLLQVEELLATKLRARQRVAELQEIAAALASWKKARADIDADVRSMQPSSESHGARPATAPLRTTRLLEFLAWESAFFTALDSAVVTLAKAAEHDERSLSRMVDDLHEDIKKVLMLPFASLLESFPKLVRDLAHAQGKQVEFVTHGAEIEIDRRLLEEMKAPLMHLVRNCVDHGIEQPEARIRKGKPPRGVVTVAISQTAANKVEIVMSDDGAGIDVPAVRAAASRLGLLPSAVPGADNEPELIALIFESGVSTSAAVTDISGRGLGLAIVREKVEKLGGSLAVETQPDVGTAFRIALPLTMTTFRGILVRVHDELFLVPTTHIEYVARVHPEDIHMVANREAIRHQGQMVSLVRLGDLLNLPWQQTVRVSPGKPYAIVLSAAEKRLAFLVDEVLDEQEVLVKPLGKQLSRIRNIAGVTLLGNGKMVPILNIPDVVKSALQMAVTTRPRPTAPGVETAGRRRKMVLVVEDSITARTLLKNILEAAGYDVKTAVDGVDALARLRSEDVDLVISDVDMPRMNGFELTAHIRSDRKLSELPVVLVTALESSRDRERGMDVGANAYLVKSSFDQSNLVEVVGRLI